MTGVARWMATAMLLLVPATARAEGPGDGVYGRLDGDLTIGLGAGGGVSLRDGEVAGTGILEARTLVLDAAGLTVSARWGPEAGEHLFVGVEMHPLFPVLFLQNRDLGHEWLDLLIQSLSLEVGVGVLPLSGGAGAGLGVGGGIEVPLVLPSRWAHGLWLRLGARWIRAREADVGGPAQDDDEWTLYATLAFKVAVRSGLAGWEPARYRRP